jgi:hypothetical protein
MKTTRSDVRRANPISGAAEVAQFMNDADNYETRTGTAHFENLFDKSQRRLYCRT